MEPRRLLSAALVEDVPGQGEPAPLPDLAVSAPMLFSPATRAALAAGDPATLWLVLSNLSDTDVPASFTGHVVLSRDDSLSADDLLLTSFHAANLPANSAVPLTASVTLPDSGTDDTWYPIAVVDPDQTTPDADPANNISVGPPLILPAKRLTLLSATVPPSVRPGQSFILTAGALVTGLHIDDPNFLTASLRRPGLTLELQPDLAPLLLPIGTDGSTTPMLLLFNATLTLPMDAPPGPYLLELSPMLFKGVASIDPTYSAPVLNVAAEAPYLSLSTPTLSDTAILPDMSFSISLTAASTGDAPTAPSTLRFYLSPTPILAFDDAQRLGTSFLAPLAPGDTRTLTPSFTPSLPPGQYYFLATLDSPNAGVFADTSTTSSPPLLLTLTAPVDPEPNPGPIPPPEPEPEPTPAPTIPTDLSIFGLSSRRTVTAGASFWIRSSPNVTGPPVRYYLSPTPTLTEDSIVLATVPAAETTALKLPRNIPPGVYHLLATIDPDNAIPESNEINNIALAPDPITIVAPALRGTLVPRPATLRLQTPHILRLTLTNPNDRPVKRNYTVTYYLSNDTVFSPDDTRLARRKISVPVIRKQSQTFTLNYKLSKSTPLGSHYFIALLTSPTGSAPLEITSRAVKITAPQLTAEVRSVRRTGPTALAATLRLTNTGTAPQTAPITLQLFAPSQRKPLLTAKRALSLPPGKSVTITIPFRTTTADNLGPSTLLATII